MPETSLLFQLGAILGIATILAIVGRAVKQPTMIAYLITGVIAGPLFLGILDTTNFIEFFAHMGITILLFIVGISLDFRVLKHIGFYAAIIGVAQALITAFLGFFIATKLGLATLPALYLAAALALSSTIVVYKLLSDKRELDTLHGKMSLGILIIQDFLAALILMVLPTVTFFSGNADIYLIFQQLAKGIGLIVGVFILSIYILPKILNSAARNQEILLLFSVVWGILVTLLFQTFGFFTEIGALIAGMSLASSRFSLEISSKIKGLRDFFIIIHLVFFGSLLVGPISGGMILNASILSLLVLIGNPLIIMTFMKLFGYKKRTGFLTGISIAQISELSLILVFIGFTLNALTQEVLSLTILIAIFTIALSSYSIFYSEKIYKFLSPVLTIFDGKGKKIGPSLSTSHNFILFGYNRIGFNLLKAFKKIL